MEKEKIGLEANKKKDERKLVGESEERVGRAGWFQRHSLNEKLKHPCVFSSDLVCRLDDIAFNGEHELGQESVQEKSSNGKKIRG